MDNERNLPDEELHDLYHQLVEARKVEDIILSKIYEHVELHITHQETLKIMINKGTALTDVLQVTAMFVFLILPFLWAGLKWWVWLWVYILIGFAVFEVVSYLSTGKTLSQQFGAYGRKNPTAKWMVLGSMVLGWLCLIWHLM